MRKFIKFPKHNGFILTEPLVILAVTAALIVPPLFTSKFYREAEMCVDNQRQIYTAVVMYWEENDYIFPGETVWKDMGIHRNVLKCPAAGKEITNAYAYNMNLVSISFDDTDTDIGDIEDSLIMLADSDREDNLMYSVEDVVLRHKREWDWAVVTFLDGHTSWYDENDFDYYIKFKKEEQSKKNKEKTQ